MNSKNLKKYNRRQQRVRSGLKKVRNNRVRLSVFVSNRNIYAQLIDDVQHKTIASASSYAMKEKSKATEVATKVAAQLADNVANNKDIAGVLKDRGVRFDRGGKIYHGVIKAFAEEARSKGFNF